MQAVLWNGKKQIQGSIKIDELLISFVFSDFNDTNLKLEIPLEEVEQVFYHKLYEITNEGLEIQSKGGKRNVFVIEDPVGLKRNIEKRIEELIKKNFNRNNT